MPNPHAYEWVKSYLKQMLKNLIKALSEENVVVEGENSSKLEPEPIVPDIFLVLSPDEVVRDFHWQLEAFWHNEHPFNKKKGQSDGISWWKGSRTDPDGRVLAVSHNEIDILCQCFSSPVPVFGAQISIHFGKLNARWMNKLAHDLVQQPP